MDVALIWLGHLHPQKCSIGPKHIWGLHNYGNNKCGLLAINPISPPQRFINHYSDFTPTTLNLTTPQKQQSTFH
jgi:hypothetical protein